MQYLHTNNAASNLRDAITPASTTITVTSGHGTLFPLPGVSQGFFVTVEDRRSGRIEIMLCTVRTGDSLTVTRGQQGTVPQSFSPGVSVANRVTAQILNEFVNATVNVVDPSRIPPIQDSMIVGMSSSKLIGTVPLALVPQIPHTKIDTMDAAKLTVGIIPSARLPNPLPAANLPAIPASKLTEVPAASLTGTIAIARIGDGSITNAKMASGQDATKITVGTLANARLPSAISVGSVATSGNVAVGGSITGDAITVTGNMQGRLVHPQDGGYVRIGAYDSASQGTGSGRFYYDALQERYIFRGHVASRAEIEAAAFFGSGAGLTGIPPLYGAIGGHDIGAVCLLLGPGSGHTRDQTYAGSSLKVPSFRVDVSSNDLTITYGDGPGGNWRALGSGSAASDERCLGLFVRYS